MRKKVEKISGRQFFDNQMNLAFDNQMNLAVPNHKPLIEYCSAKSNWRKPYFV